MHEELQIIYQSDKPYGIRDKTGFLFFFTDSPFVNEKEQSELADFLLAALQLRKQHDASNAEVSAKLSNLIEVHVGKPPSKTFATSQLFWDCECDEHYIHPASEAECYACMARRDESPDSRVDEIQRYSDELPLELVALVNAAAESIDLGIADIPF